MLTKEESVLELLLILVGEFLFLPILGMFAAVIELVALVVGGTLEVLWQLFSGRGEREVALAEESPARVEAGSEEETPLAAYARGVAEDEKRAAGGLFRRLLLAVGVVGLVLFLALQFFFFEGTLRWGLARVKASTGIDVRFASASGNLLTWSTELKGLKIARRGHPQSNFALTIDSFSADLDAWSLLWGEVKLQSFVVRGMKGTFTRLRKAPKKRKKKRPFVIQSLRLEGVKLRFQDRTREGRVLDVPLEIKRWESKPLRSTYAMFDVLFRTNAQGRFADKPFELMTRGDRKGRQTCWKAYDLPIAPVAAWVGGPLGWLKTGRLFVYVKDEWRRAESPVIELYWSMTLRDVQAEVPPHKRGLARVIAKAAVGYINKRGKFLPLEFSLTVREGQFRHTASLAATGLFQAVARALRKKLRGRSKGEKGPDSGEDGAKDGPKKGLLQKSKEKASGLLKRGKKGLRKLRFWKRRKEP